MAARAICAPGLEFRHAGRVLYEDDVVEAVCSHLTAEGWRIERTALATQRGDDIAAQGRPCRCP